MNAAAASAVAISKVLSFIYSPWFCGPVFVTPGRDTEGSLVLVEPVEQDLVVGALRELHLLGDAPCERLLVQGYEGVILLLRDLVGLLDHPVALGFVGLDEDLLGQ